MKVIFISDSDAKYGASRSMLNLAKALKVLYGDHIGITVLLAGGAWKLKKQFEEYDCEVYRVVYWPYAQSYTSNYLYSFFKLVIGWILYWLGRTIGLRLIRRKKAFSEADIIHSNSSRMDLGVFLSEWYSIPLIWHIREFGEGDFSLFYYRKDYLQLMNKSRAIITVSNAVADWWIRKGITKDLVVPIYDGVVPSNRVSRKMNPSKLRFLVLGRIDEKKGQKDVVNACARIPRQLRKRIMVSFVGDGKGEQVLLIKKGIKHNALDDCMELRGYCQDPKTIMWEYDIGIMCSRREAFGLVTAEYMMEGLATIASNSGANTEIVRDGVDGLIYNEGDPDSLCEKMTYLINNCKAIEEFGRNGKHRAYERFSIERNATSVYDVYEKVIGMHH